MAPRRTRTRSFQAREAVNPYYAAVPGIVDGAMGRFAALDRTAYHLFDYDGAPDAERVLILMGSGAETARETVRSWPQAARRSASCRFACIARSPSTICWRHCPQRLARIAVLEQTKEPGAPASPCIWTW